MEQDALNHLDILQIACLWEIYYLRLLVSKQIASLETETQRCYTQLVSELLDYTVFRVDLLLGCECGMKEMQPLKHHGEWLGWDEA